MDPLYNGPKFEAKRGSGSTYVQAPREVDAEDFEKEARVYGTRRIEVKDADGGTHWEEVPLTWEDLFDPQEGDWLMEGREHGKLANRIGSSLDSLFKARGYEDVAVFMDVRMDWKTPGVSSACPDVAVIPGMTEEQADKADVFDEAKEGTGPSFVLEVTSKSTAVFDRKDKRKIYRQASVPEIFLLDRLRSPWILQGERRNPQTGRYRKIRPDKQGRLFSEKLSVYFGIVESGDDVTLVDAETGEVLRSHAEESEARRAAEQKAAEESKARQAAEQEAAEEAKARVAAEAKLQELLAKMQRIESTGD